MRTFFPFVFNLLFGDDGETRLVYIVQRSHEFFSFCGTHFYIVADMDFVLPSHLEGLPDTCRAHLKFKILFIAVKTVLDEPRKIDAILYPHTLCVVYLHYNTVIGTNREVGKEILLIVQPLVYKFSDKFFADHFFSGH